MFDSDSYMNEMRALLESGKAVSMVLSGNSMVPFLVNQRDLIYIEPLPSELKVGDMCFFQRDDGRFIMHRICRVTKDGCFFVGDAQPVIEGPIRRDQMFGIVTKVKRKGKWITHGNLTWEFFEKVWIRMIPLRIPVLKLYGRLR